MGAPMMFCPACGRQVKVWNERKDQRGLAQDLKVISSHGHRGRRCLGSAKRLAPDDPRLVGTSAYRDLVFANATLLERIEQLQRQIALDGGGPRPRIEVM